MYKHIRTISSCQIPVFLLTIHKSQTFWCENIGLLRRVQSGDSADWSWILEISDWLDKSMGQNVGIYPSLSPQSCGMCIPLGHICDSPCCRVYSSHYCTTVEELVTTYMGFLWFSGNRPSPGNWVPVFASSIGTPWKLGIFMGKTWNYRWGIFQPWITRGYQRYEMIFSSKLLRFVSPKTEIHDLGMVYKIYGPENHTWTGSLLATKHCISWCPLTWKLKKPTSQITTHCRSCKPIKPTFQCVELKTYFEIHRSLCKFRP